jgi:hypothetical protein
VPEEVPSRYVINNFKIYHKPVLEGYRENQKKLPQTGNPRFGFSVMVFVYIKRTGCSMIFEDELDGASP